MRRIIPDYWKEHLEDKIRRINSLQGDGSFGFIVITDCHYPRNMGKLSPLIAKEIAERTNVGFVLCLGDVQTSGCYDTKEEIIEENKLIDEFLSPVGDRLLIVEGNHDGSYGWLDRDGNGVFNNDYPDGTVKPPEERESYVNNLNSDEIYQSIYEKVSLIDGVTFDKGGSHGYYVDDNADKVRFIMLNSHNNKYELREDGTPRYPKMWYARFGQSQLDMVVEAIKGIPDDDWSVVVGAHFPLGQGEIADGEVLAGILNAYKTKTSYSGSVYSVYEQVTVNCDLSDAKGEPVGYFAGHTHVDRSSTYCGVTVIETTCDTREDIDLSVREKRSAGNVSEQSFDVFTINRKEHRIYVTRIGSGTDRIIEY